MSFELLDYAVDKVLSRGDYPIKKPAHPKKIKNDLTEIRYIDLFAGIGGIRLPFEDLGYQNVFSSEIDAAASKTYEANFGDKPHGDITKINEKNIPDHDLLLAGFPCQAFSIMGKKLGFADTRGTMFFEIERILKHHKPRAILLENVKQLVTHDKGRTLAVILESLKNIGYFVKWKVLNALHFGLPQKRERIVIVGFLDESLAESFSFDFEPISYDLKNILESDDVVDKNLFASERILEKRKMRTASKKVVYPSIWHENKAGNVSVLEYACALRTGASYNYLLVNGYRRPSSRELLRLQGFPDSYKIVVSHAEIRRQTGNSVPVNMIRAVALRINHALKHNTQQKEVAHE
jgi:DNA (cytosine-5)-methyltransferase 1